MGDDDLIEQASRAAEGRAACHGFSATARRISEDDPRVFFEARRNGQVFHTKAYPLDDLRLRGADAVADAFVTEAREAPGSGIP